MEPNGQDPFVVPNQSMHGKYNLISVSFNKMKEVEVFGMLKPLGTHLGAHFKPLSTILQGDFYGGFQGHYKWFPMTPRGGRISSLMNFKKMVRK